jgi:5-methylcytosine-specific restriction endonuclease McrA
MAQSYTRSEEQKKRDASQKRQWYLRNREAVLAKQKANRAGRAKEEAAYQLDYRLKNKEKLAESKKQYYLANKERIAQYKKVHSRQNRDKINAYHRRWERAWYASDPTRALLKIHKRRAKTRVDIDKTLIYNWHTKVCGICNLPIEDKFHIDHKVPLAKGGLHVVENLQLAHPVCNLRKNDKLDFTL